ncbi:MAG: M23 family metallopeptidase, partial [Stackebrandtia sp.]
MDTPHREPTSLSRYLGRHRPPLLTRTVFAALATAAVLGSGLTAASAAPPLDDATPVADAPADHESEDTKEPEPAPSKEKPSSEDKEKKPDGNDAEKKEEKKKPKPAWVVPSGDAISDTFGPREWRGGQMHAGLDFAAEEGDPNYAAAAGTVTKAGPDGGFGNLVVIDHGNGVETWYGHHSKLSVQVGDTVKPGDQTGLAGSTGDITGPHLHFEVHVD